MIVLDTSVLVDALSGSRSLATTFAKVLATGERLRLPAPVLYEWLCGQRTVPELALQRVLFPDERTLAFGPVEARVAADLHLSVAGLGERQAAIAACALTREGQLWTTRQPDFAEIPGLALFRPAPPGNGAPEPR